MSGNGSPRVAVVVAAFNEEKFILDTLRGLDAQRFDTLFQREVLGGFRVIVVDNNSTDRTADLVEEFIAAGTRVPFELITETEKGTGCAVDTGTRHAIAGGAAFIARTDADTIPAPDWLSNLLRPLVAGKRLVGGRLRARTDEGSTAKVFNAVGALWRIGHAVDWVQTRNLPDEERRSFAVCGPSMAFDADIYERSGGFPRTKIDDEDEDHVLQVRVRKVAGGDAIALAKDAVVFMSLRRLQGLGAKDYIAWYGTDDRDTTGKQIDIR
ncbi:glycosyltransferase [Williamsia sp. M5A3_1d]